MKRALKTFIIFVISLNITACQWSLEPLPSTSISLYQTGLPPSGIKHMGYKFEGEHRNLFEEIWQAELERSPIRIAQNAKTQLGLTLKSYHYESEDDLDVLPGVLAPGLVPFGPLGFWWVYDDLSEATPSLRVELLAVLTENGNNRSGGPQLIVNCEVTRGITTQESLARTAFSLASIKVLEWLESKNNK